MKNLFLSTLLLISSLGYTQKVQWACAIAETNDPNKGDYKPEKALHVPDAYPSGQKSNGYTYCIGFTYEKAKAKKIPDITVKFEYCTPIIAEQVAIIESYKPGTVVKVVLYDINGKSTVVYKGKAAAVAEESRIFPVLFDKTSAPVKYVSITFEPGAVGSVNCIDAVALCPTKAPVEVKINLGADLHFISSSTPLSPKVNSEYEDILPIISPSGKVLYFDRKDHPQNIRNPDDIKVLKDDIYFSIKDKNGNWSEAANIGKPLNNYGHNFVNSISPDGNTMLLANTYNADGSPKGGGASITKRVKGQGWSFPEALDIKEYKNKNDYVSYFMANTNNVLLMSIEDNDSYGEKDICVSFRQADNSWSKPKNIGPDINTIQEEYSPVLASDNKTMYFASKGHIGYGSYDIFVTKRLDDSWVRWSTPINLGPSVNNLHSNMGFSIPASGKEIYTYGWESKERKDEIFITQLGDAVSIQPDPVYLVHGRVFDAKTKKPIHADIVYELLPNGEMVGSAGSDPDNGEYKIVLPTGEHYGYFAKSPGYFSVHENLEIPNNSKYTEFEKDLYMTPIEVGQKMALNNVFFVQSQSVLTKGSFPELDRVANILLSNTKIELRIEGHTDNHGDADKNKELSEKRAEAVRAYLILKNVSPKRITTRGYGGVKPIASNAKEETRKLNRRVEFVITKL